MDKEKFSSRFKNRRKDMELTQEAFLEQFNSKYNRSFTVAAISQYENGKRLPEVDALIDFADFFGVSVDYLLGLERAEERKLCWCDRIELSENMVAYYRNGRLVVKHLPDEWMKVIVKVIESV